MARRPTTNPAEYLQLARRRWIWILVPAIVVAGATVAGARYLPKTYRSEALILVEPQRVPTDFVTPTVSSDVALRLETIEEQILSRTQLSQLIQQYGLYRGLQLTPDQQVTRMLGDIIVVPTVDSTRPNSPITAFTITFSASDPVLAQEVTSKLSSLFISENLQARSQQAEGTEAFISGQLTQADQTLHTLEGQLKQLKSQYMGSLPEQQSANLTVLGQLQTALQTNSDALARAQQQKTYLTSLGQAVEELGPNGAPMGTPPDPLSVELRNAKTQLAIAEQQYTPEHPDVISLVAQVKALTAQVAAEAAAKPKPKAGAKAPAPGLLPQDQGQVALLDKEIQQRTKDQTAIQTKIDAMQKRIEQLPEVEEKLTNLQNSYNVAKANDTVLLQKQAAAAMGAAMEQQSEGEGFRMIDPANLPLKPYSPNLLRIDTVGACGGLVLGLGLAFLMDMREGVARNELDVAYYTKMPILAALPTLPKAALPPAPLGLSGASAASGEAR
ncbi:MAG: GumC family protein [Terriglobales bacterium]